jgi:prepilin-type N-terminal cleavage/methylation domain-containing protein
MSLRPFSRTQGFTLVELMVAIAVMALLALVSWRGLDSMVRAQESIRARNEQQMVLQTVIAQWNADLEALMPLEYAQAIDWDGQVLRMTRKSSAAVEPCCCPWTNGACTTTGTMPGAIRSPAARATPQARRTRPRAGPTAAPSCPRFLTASASN